MTFTEQDFAAPQQFTESDFADSEPFTEQDFGGASPEEFRPAISFGQPQIIAPGYSPAYPAGQFPSYTAPPEGTPMTINDRLAALRAEDVPLSSQLAGRAAAGIEKGMTMPERAIRGGLDLLGWYKAMDAVLGTGNQYQDYNQSWQKSFTDRDQQLDRESADLGDAGLLGDVVEGTGRAATELPVQLLGGAAGAARGAALKGAALTAGLTSGLGSYAQDRGQGRGQAESAAYGATSGLITGLTTAAFGTTGVESVLRKEGVKGVARRIGDVFKQSGMEGGEEVADQFQQDLLERVARNPNKPIEQSVREGLGALFIGAAIGGGVSGAGTVAQGGMEQLQSQRQDTAIDRAITESANEIALQATFPRNWQRLRAPAEPQGLPSLAEAAPTAAEFVAGDRPRTMALEIEPELESPSNALQPEAAQPVRPLREEPIQGQPEVPAEIARGKTDVGGDQSAEAAKKIAADIGGVRFDAVVDFKIPNQPAKWQWTMMNPDGSEGTSFITDAGASPQVVADKSAFKRFQFDNEIADTAEAEKLWREQKSGLPVIEAGGKLYPGTSHADALERVNADYAAGKITKEDRLEVLMAFTDDAAHKFQLSDGSVVNRAEMGKRAGLGKAAESADLETNGLLLPVESFKSKPPADATPISAPPAPQEEAAVAKTGSKSPVLPVFETPTLQTEELPSNIKVKVTGFDRAGKTVERTMSARNAGRWLEGRQKLLRALRDCMG